MELLIDTWNVLHQTGVLPAESAGIGIHGLCRLIGGSRWCRDRVTLFCDGTSSTIAPLGVKFKIVFTGPSRTADEEIMDVVANSSSPKSILVITSDREIIKSIRTRGSQHMASSDFLQSLVDDSHKPKPQSTHRPSSISPTLAQEWKEHFGIDDKVLEELHNTHLDELPNKSAPKPNKTEPKKIKTKRTINPDEPVLPTELLEEARRLLGEQ